MSKDKIMFCISKKEKQKLSQWQKSLEYREAELKKKEADLIKLINEAKK